MTIRGLLPLIAATFLCSGSVLVEARPPKRPASQPKPTVAQPVQPKWKLFTAPDGRFTILMPGMPQRETQTQKTYMGEINLEIFVAQPPKQQVAYLVTYNDFPYSYGQMANPQEILNKAQVYGFKNYEK